MDGVKIRDFMKAIRKPVEMIKIFTSDYKIVRVDVVNDKALASDIAELDAVTNLGANNFEINYNSKTKTLLLYSALSLDDLDVLLFPGEVAIHNNHYIF